MLKEKIKFLIFGGNRLKEDMPVSYLINFLKKNKIKYLLITDPTHLNKSTHTHKKFKYHLKKKEFISFKKLNEKKVLDLISSNTYGVSINSVWKFTKNIIKKFNGKLYNYHAADLPEARGAANISWKIMSDNNKSISINIHTVDEEFDTGKIVQKKKIKLSNVFLPKDILKVISLAEKSFLIDFIVKIFKGKKMIKKTQKGQSFYWPRLNSDKDGRINWNWDAKSISQFIRAFSRPYNGAFSFINNNKVKIFNAKFSNKKKIPSFSKRYYF